MYGEWPWHWVKKSDDDEDEPCTEEQATGVQIGPFYVRVHGSWCVWAHGLRMLCPTTASSDRVQGFTFERRDDWGWEVAQEVRLSVFVQIFAWREGQWLHTSLTLLSGHTDVLSADAA